jgi:hypothetical protein
MSTHTLMRGSLAAIAGVGAMLLAATTVQAAMAPSPAGSYAPSDVQVVGCDVRVHVGPIGMRRTGVEIITNIAIDDSAFGGLWACNEWSATFDFVRRNWQRSPRSPK